MEKLTEILVDWNAPHRVDRARYPYEARLPDELDMLDQQKRLWTCVQWCIDRQCEDEEFLWHRAVIQRDYGALPGTIAEKKGVISGIDTFFFGREQDAVHFKLIFG